MNYEKIIKRDDGTQYRITVITKMTNINGPIEYAVVVHTRQKGKLKWVGVSRDIGEWEYRSMPLEERRKYDEDNLFQYVTKDEVYQAKIEAWELIKPKQS